MKALAGLDPETAHALVGFLAKEGIVCESRAATDEQGFDVTEVLVAEADYDRACDAAERWQAALAAEAEKRAQRRCPACQSPNVVYLDGIDYEKTLTKIAAMYRCEDCGHVIATK